MHKVVIRSGRMVVAAATSGVLVVAGVGLAYGSAPGAASAVDRSAPTQVQAPVPVISWHVCGDRPAYRCGTAQVPLDYDAPQGATISLNLVKRFADLPHHRIGSLFVNPGGPGGSSADFVPYAARLLGAPVRQHFDLIGIDPRGIAGSTAVHCDAKAGDPPLPPYPPVAFPRGDRQLDQWFAYDDGVRRLCAQRGTPILDHMSTADTARDMDLIRQAVGDSQLTYYGISYGTQLGSTYAAMFPSRVRAMVLDGVLDPVQWTTGRFGQGDRYLVSARLRSGYGAWEALNSALDECDRVGPRFCQFAGHIGEEWTKVITTLRAGPVRVHGGRLTYAYVLGTILGGLYDEDVYPEIMDFIHQVYEQISEPSPTAAAAAAVAWKELRADVVRSGRTVPRYQGGLPAASTSRLAGDQLSPGFQGVICADSVNPADKLAAIPSARFANQQGPGFGAVWSWATSTCSSWPGSGADAFRGPWRTTTAHPIVLTGNLHDPATPISGARAVNKLFPGSRMITVDTWGHGALGQSDCAVSKWDRYFLTLRLPAAGLVCQPDHDLFPG
jgi:pimeloyl-ACP methyl ester carboxylesterase